MASLLRGRGGEDLNNGRALGKGAVRGGSWVGAVWRNRNFDFCVHLVRLLK